MNMSKKSNNTMRAERIMWTKAQRPRCTKNMVEKRIHDDKKYKKDYRYEY